VKLASNLASVKLKNACNFTFDTGRDAEAQGKTFKLDSDTCGNVSINNRRKHITQQYRQL
jgi:hypothetical protein